MLLASENLWTIFLTNILGEPVSEDEGVVVWEVHFGKDTLQLYSYMVLTLREGILFLEYLDSEKALWEHAQVKVTRCKPSPLYRWIQEQATPILGE